MRFILKRLIIILPVFLVTAGFGPFDWNKEEPASGALTHISLEDKTYLSKEELDQKLAEYQSKNIISIKSPQRTRREAKPGAYIVSATAYSSTVDQCDSTPFITASGQYVRDGIIATNFLPFGTKVKVPELYGDKVFEVQDRMNARYSTRVDFWMPSRGEAIKFGLKQIKIEVL
ncbi:MAG: hypothetical protein WC650_03735 [Candidatus Doudnabacteria bacterium]